MSRLEPHCEGIKRSKSFQGCSGYSYLAQNLYFLERSTAKDRPPHKEKSSVGEAQPATDTTKLKRLPHLHVPRCCRSPCDDEISPSPWSSWSLVDTLPFSMAWAMARHIFPKFSKTFGGYSWAMKRQRRSDVTHDNPSTVLGIHDFPTETRHRFTVICTEYTRSGSITEPKNPHRLMASTSEALLLEMNRRNLQLVNQKAPTNGTGRTNETSGNSSGIFGTDTIVCDAQFFQMAVFLQRVHQHLAAQDADVVLPQVHHMQGGVAHEPLHHTSD